MIACFWFRSTARSTPLTISVPSSRATCRFLISSSATCQKILCSKGNGPAWSGWSMVAGPKCRYAGRMPNVGPWEIILILLLALLLFGAKRLPEIGRSVGQGMREFKDSVSGGSKGEPQELEPPSRVEKPAPTATHEHDTV